MDVCCGRMCFLSNDVPEELDTLAMEKKLGELTPTEEFVAMLRVSLKQVCGLGYLT